MSEQRILVAGVPSSGKSTYIAALRHVLLSNETASALVMSQMADDERHLNALQDRWLALDTFERTREASEAWVEFHVRGQAGGDEAKLIIPDLRGELFERPAATGTCLRSIADALSEADGVLLFTNADKPDDEHLISDFGDVGEDEDHLEHATAETAAADQCGAKGQHRDVVPKSRLRFQPDRMPEEAKIVELLQFANRRPRARRLRRIAVVVSAWDVVIDGGDQRAPAQWFAHQRLQLEQFLRYNADAWDVRVYGASAQGGQLPRDAARLQALENASERVIMVGPGVPRHDPTAPIAWLIRGG